jgi:hypothetical protein
LEIGIEVILSIVAIVISVVGTIASIVYSYKNVKMANKQFELLKQESESRREFREAIKTIRNVLDKIKTLKVSLGELKIDGLDRIRNEILQFLHDKKENLTLSISIVSIHIGGLDPIHAYPTSLLEPFASFQDLFEKKLSGNVVFDFINVDPKSHEDIHDLPLVLTLYLSQISSIRQIQDELNKVKHVVSPYDRQLIEDMNDTYVKLLRLVHSCIVREFGKYLELQFNLKMKTNQILNEILKIINFETFVGSIIKFQVDITKRLDDVQRQIIPKI